MATENPSTTLKVHTSYKNGITASVSLEVAINSNADYFVACATTYHFHDLDAAQHWYHHMVDHGRKSGIPLKSTDLEEWDKL